jgi:ubiquinone/menaquinone biosynthesis C-methylase UbiE
MLERRDRILADSIGVRARKSLSFVTGSLRVASERTLQVFSRGERARPLVDLVDYKNDDGEVIRGIVDSYGDRRGAPVVVIPPAWGKTKETLLPLAMTIVSSFAKERHPVAVVRFDGIRRRGESYNEPQCRFPGREYYRFSFSQGVKDIAATLDFLYGSQEFKPSTVILVTFSAASIDGRRAVASGKDGQIGGWISVVGAPDLQSAMRVVSGGIDYLGGYEKGVRFGFQEVQGVTVDMDYAAADALEHRLAFLEDARRDMAAITTPISWIHGRFDAWMDLKRVQHLVSIGGSENRRLIEVPTGHQLRSSKQALDVFQLIAAEVGRLALRRSLSPVLPKLSLVSVRTKAERARLPKPDYEPRGFWKDYLVGRDGWLGIELMTATSAYSDLMRAQIEELGVRTGMRIADLGSGTGALLLQLLESERLPEGIHVNEIDFVREALGRARKRASKTAISRFLSAHYLQCDLDLDQKVARIPLSDRSQDAVLASLMISYLQQPDTLLKEIKRVLVPGGRLVLSTLVPDADTSKIYAEGAAELRSGRARELLGASAEAHLEPSLRSFMNDAARLLDLEERGVFKFWEPADLEHLIRRAGFEILQTRTAFGDPKQAIIVTARSRPHRQ